MELVDRIEYVYLAIYPQAARVDLAVDACSDPAAAGYRASVLGAAGSGERAGPAIELERFYARPSAALAALAAELETRLDEHIRGLEDVRRERAGAPPGEPAVALPSKYMEALRAATTLVPDVGGALAAQGARPRPAGSKRPPAKTPRKARSRAR